MALRRMAQELEGTLLTDSQEIDAMYEAFVPEFRQAEFSDPGGVTGVIVRFNGEDIQEVWATGYTKPYSLTCPYQRVYVDLGVETV